MFIKYFCSKCNAEFDTEKACKIHEALCINQDELAKQYYSETITYFNNLNNPLCVISTEENYDQLTWFKKDEYGSTSSFRAYKVHDITTFYFYFIFNVAKNKVHVNIEINSEDLYKYYPTAKDFINRIENIIKNTREKKLIGKFSLINGQMCFNGFQLNDLYSLFGLDNKNIILTF